MQSTVKLFLVLCLTWTALSPSALSAAQSATVRVILPPFGTLDPVALSPADQTGRDLVENLFAGLTRYDPLTKQIVPALAESWSVSPDGLEWTFRLRDAQWVRVQNGVVVPVRPIVAGDFVFALRRACDAPPPNPAAKTVFVISGCRKIATTNPLLVDDLFIARELGVRVVNLRTLALRLEFPAPMLPFMLALPEFRPVPRESVSLAAENSDWAVPSAMLSSGAYALAERDAQSLTLLRNPFWHDRTGNIEQVTVAFAPSESAADLFISQSADFARLSRESATQLAMSAPESLISMPSAAVILLGFAAERPVTMREELRRALALSIDRNALAQQLSGTVPTWRLTTPAVAAVALQSEAGIFSPQAAKAQLIAAGYAACRLPERLELVIEDTPRMEALANALFAQWQANLGCNAQNFRLTKRSTEVVRRLADGTFSTIRTTDPIRPHMWLFTWSPDYLDVTAWTGDGAHCRYGFLKSYVPCGEADQLVNAALLESDLARRAELVEQAERRYFGENGTFPVVPLLTELRFAARRPNLQGVSAAAPLWFAAWSR
ncbi:MAG: ABC transporter substrate-binding protein [Anaerolineae bacterium]|nr:ABC transporter substrate-binding protein [Anaerolineae bacterium]